MKNSFKWLDKLKKFRDGYYARVNTNGGNEDPPMHNIKQWFKENKIYFSIWLIIAYLAVWASISLKIDISGKIDYKIEYKQPWVVENILSNKK